MTEQEQPEQPEIAEEMTASEEPVSVDRIAEELGEMGAKAEGKKVSQADYPPPPPASFEVLLSMIFTQAMSMLGQIPDPSTGEATINKPFAKHSIDTLEMLGEKTKGNLTDDEAKMLSEAMHALRMAYVSVRATST